jgi:hypothetical protein
MTRIGDYGRQTPGTEQQFANSFVIGTEVLAEESDHMRDIEPVSAEHLLDVRPVLAALEERLEYSNVVAAEEREAPVV